MEKVRPRSGQPSDRERLENRTEQAPKRQTPAPSIHVIRVTNGAFTSLLLGRPSSTMERPSTWTPAAGTYLRLF